jgi:hypothetical protein
MGTFANNFLDSPATTSSLTYNVQMAIRGTGSGTWFLNQSSGDSDSTETARAASTITLMEIAA